MAQIYYSPIFHRILSSSLTRRSIISPNNTNNASRLIVSNIAATAPLSNIISNSCNYSRNFSSSSDDDTTTTPIPGGCYAVVDHSQAYVEAMAGRHGKQLSLAYDESKRVLEKEKVRQYYKNLLREEERDLNDKEEEEEGTKLLESSEDVVAANDDNSVQEEEELYDDEEDEDEEDEYDDVEANEMVVPSYEYLTPAKRAAYKAGAPSGSKFAIIRLAKSSQFKITMDDVIICNKLKPTSYYSVGSIRSIPCEDILLVGDSNKTNIGLPHVKGAEVLVRVEEITHDKTVIVFKKRRRKSSKRKNGHRREVTFLRVLDIRFPEEAQEENDIVAAA